MKSTLRTDSHTQLSLVDVGLRVVGATVEGGETLPEDERLINAFLVSSRMPMEENRLWPHTRFVIVPKSARQNIAFTLK